MTSRLCRLLTGTALLLAGSSLAGCAGLNEKASAAMGDYVPQWAGGLPADAPPRPGTAKYDAWMKERERLRELPADQRPPDPQGTASSAPAKPFSWSSSPTTATPTSKPGSAPSTTSGAATPSGLDPVH